MSNGVGGSEGRWQERIRPRARLLQLLGDQLIGSPRLAIFELVKNAYDADATLVTIEMLRLGTDDAAIIVEDDGDGMSYSTIRDIWLVPAHDHRERQRLVQERTRKGRLPLGEKGVGRFAVHKLGEHVELVTRTQGEQELRVEIYWPEVLGQEFLEDARVEIEAREAQVFTGDRTGTRVAVKELRERNLSRGEVRRLLRQITSISNPFHEREDAFDAKLYVPEHPDWIDSIPDVVSLMDQAPWVYQFKVDADGIISWSYEFRGFKGISAEPRRLRSEKEKLQLPQSDLREDGVDDAATGGMFSARVASSEFMLGIGAVAGQFYVFDRDKELLQRTGGGQLVIQFLDENGGVRVYRDGMRVYNYGERSDDWLGLDLRRVNTPAKRISRNIVVGVVDLQLEDSGSLREKTNREGFVENGAYDRLRRVVIGALAPLETERKRDKDRVRKMLAGPREQAMDAIEKPLEQLRAAVRRSAAQAEIDPIIDRLERDYGEMRETMLRVGVSGTSLSIVFHEIEQGVRVLHKTILSGANPEDCVRQAAELLRLLDGFSDLLRKGDRKSNSLYTLIRRARDINRVRFRHHVVELIAPDLETQKSGPNAVFAFGLALGALNNIIDNSIYWMDVRWDGARNARRKLFIGASEVDFDGPAILIADTGPGFTDSQEEVTKPFFTRRPGGMGVGLYYANLVMELNMGSMLILEPGEASIPNGFDGAALALVFPRGN